MLAQVLRSVSPTVLHALASLSSQLASAYLFQQYDHEGVANEEAFVQQTVLPLLRSLYQLLLSLLSSRGWRDALFDTTPLFLWRALCAPPLAASGFVLNGEADALTPEAGVSAPEADAPLDSIHSFSELSRAFSERVAATVEKMNDLETDRFALQLLEWISFCQVDGYLRLAGERELVDLEDAKKRDQILAQTERVKIEAGVQEHLWALSDLAYMVLRQHKPQGKRSLSEWKQSITCSIRLCVVYARDPEKRLEELIEVKIGSDPSKRS